MGAQPDYLQPGDVAKLHQGVCADVPTAAARPGPLGIDPPFGLHDTLILGPPSQPTLEIVSVHPAHLAEQPAAHDVA